MSIFRGILAAGAALLASTLVAQSADLYGGYGGRGSIKDGPVYDAAPRGCPSWYVRVDGGYSTFDRPAMTQIGVDDIAGPRIQGTGNFGTGIGHYFSCNIRGDITFDQRFKSDMSGSNLNPFAPNFGRMTWGYQSQAYMANAYYDFNMRSRFTPYIGFGLGTVHNTFTRGKGVVGAGAAGAGHPTTVGGGESWHAAGAFMTGFTFALHNRLTLDTGYRFLYLGGNKTGQTIDTVWGGLGGPITAENIHAHEFRVGLRYDIR